MKMKRTGWVLRIALVLRTGWITLSRLRFNSASISIDIDWCFQRVLENVNFQRTHFAGFSSTCYTAALSQLNGEAVVNANSVRADFTGNIITGTGLNSSFPVHSRLCSNRISQMSAMIFPISSLSPALAVNQPVEIKPVCFYKPLYKFESATRYFLFIYQQGTGNNEYERS